MRFGFRALWAFILILPLFLIATPAMAQQDFIDPHWNESPINWTGGFKFGLGFPSDTDFTDVYGEKGIPFYSMEFSYKMVHEFELQAEMSYWWDQGRGIAGDGKQTNEKYKLHMAPAELGLGYRFNFVYDQPVVPYFGAAFVYEYFLEERLESSYKKRGAKYGVAGKGGLMILLDKAEKRASAGLENAWGINNTYLIYNYKYYYVNSFDDKKGLDLSAQVHTLGFLFEF